MRIKKILNNNAVIAVNEKSEDIVITGLGLAFKKRVGDYLDDEKIERIFRMEDKEVSKKLKRLISEIPVEFVEATEEIVKIAKTELDVKLNENIYLTLTDHLSFAVYRLKNNLEVTNPLYWEIKRLYQREYKVGLKALDMIKEKFGVALPEEEATSIAMHIVNAEMGLEMSNAIKVVKILQDLLNIIKYHFGTDFVEESIDYQRMATHLKFYAQRIVNSEILPKDSVALFDIVKMSFPDALECALKIKNYAVEKHDFETSEEEMAYLIVHIERVVNGRKE